MTEELPRPENGSVKARETTTSAAQPAHPPSMSWKFLSLRVLIPCLLAWAVYRLSNLGSISTPPSTSPVPLSAIPISLVLRQNLALASRSWEFGVLIEALLELQNPEFTVYAGLGRGVHLSRLPGEVPGTGSLSAFPAGKLPSANGRRFERWTSVKGLRYASALIWTNHSGFVERDGGCLVDGDGSSTDPASLGPAALLLAAADPVENEQYSLAAHRQAFQLRTAGLAQRYIIDDSHSVISHRDGPDPPQVWADTVYMVAPFFALLGVADGRLEWLEQAMHLVEMYAGALKTPTGLWKHIAVQSESVDLSPGQCCIDPGVWLTGNAWALAGMLRVLATVERYVPLPGLDMTQEYTEFKNHTVEKLHHLICDMLTGLSHPANTDRATGLLKNYLDQGEHDFGDAAGTALVAASIYRLKVLAPAIPKQSAFDYEHDWDIWADTAYNAVATQIDRSSGIVRHVANIGQVPCKTWAENGTSEGQSFVLLMWAARRDCVKAGQCRGKEVKLGWL